MNIFKSLKTAQSFENEFATGDYLIPDTYDK